MSNIISRYKAILPVSLFALSAQGVMAQDATEADNSSSDSENTSNEEIIDQDDTNGASGGTESSDDDYEYDEE